MKGDRVEIVIDAGGATRTYEVAATRAGRRVEVVTRRGVVEVTELTRGGTPCGPPGSWPAACSPWWSTRPTGAPGPVRASRARPRNGRSNRPRRALVACYWH